MNEPTRPAPRMPTIKPVRPDYETILRDEFAGRALSGMLASPSEYKALTTNDFAASAYRYADAMMEARNADR